MDQGDIEQMSFEDWRAVFTLNVAGTRNPETKARRVEQAIAKMREGRVRAVFADKLQATHDQLAQLRAIENDLLEAIEYLDSCDTCTPDSESGSRGSEVIDRNE